MANIKFKIKIAEVRIGIECIYSQTKVYCQDYLTNEKAEVYISVTQDDIDFERKKSIQKDEAEGRIIRPFTDEYLETLAVYRKIAVVLLQYDTILFHGSVLSMDGKGYLFTAKSGTGKSTHASLWREQFGDRVVIVNDDKPLLKIKDGQVIAYGTPWDGKHHLSRNIAVPLKAISILHRGKENHIEAVNKRAAFPIIMQQVFRPKEKEQLLKTLQLTDRLVSFVPVYHLECNMETEAALISYRGMKG